MKNVVNVNDESKLESEMRATGKSSPQKKGKVMANNEGRKLFKPALQAQEALEAHDKQREALVAARSEAIKAIHDSMGAGPFQVKGEIVTIRSRKDKGEKDEEGNVTREPDPNRENYYFVKMGDKQVTVID